MDKRVLAWGTKSERRAYVRILRTELAGMLFLNEYRCRPLCLLGIILLRNILLRERTYIGIIYRHPSGCQGSRRERQQ